MKSERPIFRRSSQNCSLHA